ncbi:MAG: hypothetical protein JNK82_06340 [Myxococcaceae bacterium]|nr:hypothetical protein [Myxococcaceae bacterium]
MRFALALALALTLALVCACAAPAPEGLMAAKQGPGPKVKFDIFHKPLPDIPLPNDYATDIDDRSPTKRVINASIEAAHTKWEKATRAELDKISGWGTLAPISVAFSELLDVEDIARRHQTPTDVQDDAIYVIDVDETSPEKCQPVLLDLGQGHFPVVLDRKDYYNDEPHQANENLIFNQEEEDLDGDGELDPGEDTDMDGVLDHPNVLIPGQAGPFDVMTFYERETNTLIAKPLYPMRPGTTYAVVLTNRLVGKADGEQVRSPFPAINHAMQTTWLKPLPGCLGQLGLSLDDVAFTWTFTTQAVHAQTVAIRDGLWGRGSLQWLNEKYPAVIELEPVRRATSRTTNVNIVPGNDFLAFGSRLFELYGGGAGAGPGTKQVLEDALSFVDFYTSGSFVSPQFFPRESEQGKWLPLYKQTWDVIPATGHAFNRPENVPFFAATPKGRSGPAPVVIFVHGHTSSKLDGLIMMGPMARFGIATISIDAVSHGVGLDDTLQEVVNEIVKPYGLEPMMKAIIKGRAIDQDADGVVDSGADFYTGYVVHTRDTVRQTAVDTMQLVRVLRSFDGVRRWEHDVNKDGEPDIAGDFDGDGKVDMGGPTVPIYLAGASLGGILSSLVGGLEPEVDAMVPILPGGYLSEIGARSSLGQIRNALILRMMSPLMNVRNGALTMTLPKRHNESVELKLADMPSLRPGSIAVARNLTTGEWRCARVQPSGNLRISVPTDENDKLQLELYNPELPSREREGCETKGFSPWKVVSTFEYEVKYEGKTYAKDSTFVAPTDGFGMRRASPDLRRLLSLAQIGLEAADPANVAPHYAGTRKLVAADGQEVATHALMIPMTGDSGVSIASAMALLRAAGLLDYKNVDPRYGKTAMQALIDTGFVEGVERTGRWKDANGRNVLYDVDVLQSVANADDGFGTPRLSPPIRLLKPAASDPTKTIGALFPMMNPQGDHSFPVPDPNAPFDLGMLIINVFGNYLKNGNVPLEPCMEDTSCAWIPQVQR